MRSVLPSIRPFRSLPVLLAALLSIAAKAPPPVAPPALDPLKVVNQSYGFLREREPEMSEVEYALYERMLPIVETAPETALTLLETMLADDKPESAAFEFVLGNVYFTLKRMDGAERHYRKAVDQYPTFLRAWVNLGAVHFAAEKYREAIPCFARAVALGDRDAATYGLLAASLRHAGNLFAAESAYKSAMTADPLNPDWINGLLEIYLTTEQFGPATALARELVHVRPEEPRHWHLYAGLLVRQERSAEAIAALRLAGDLKLLTPDLWQLLGDLYAEMGLSAAAGAAYSHSGDSVQGPRALVYAEVLLDRHDWRAASEVLNGLPAPESRTDRARFLRVRARLAWAQNQEPEARALLEEALTLDPLNGPALLALAEVHRGQNRLAEAEICLEQAAQVTDSAFSAQVELAQLALHLRDYPRAVRHTRSALELQPSPELEDFLTRLNALVDHENSASAPSS